MKAVLAVFCTAAICGGLFFVWKSSEDSRRVAVDRPRHSQHFQHEYLDSCDLADVCVERELAEIDKAVALLRHDAKADRQRPGLDAERYNLDSKISGLSAFAKSDAATGKIEAMRAHLAEPFKQTPEKKADPSSKDWPHPFR